MGIWDVGDTGQLQTTRPSSSEEEEQGYLGSYYQEAHKTSEYGSK